MDGNTDYVYIFTLCKGDFENVRIAEKGSDRQLVADEMLTKVI